jgi:hypothetical protein
MFSVCRKNASRVIKIIAIDISLFSRISAEMLELANAVRAAREEYFII